MRRSGVIDDFAGLGWNHRAEVADDFHFDGLFEGFLAHTGTPDVSQFAVKNDRAALLGEEEMHDAVKFEELGGMLLGFGFTGHDSFYLGFVAAARAKPLADSGFAGETPADIARDEFIGQKSAWPAQDQPANEVHEVAFLVALANELYRERVGGQLKFTSTVFSGMRCVDFLLVGLHSFSSVADVLHRIVSGRLLPLAGLVDFELIPCGIA